LGKLKLFNLLAVGFIFEQRKTKNMTKMYEIPRTGSSKGLMALSLLEIGSKLCFNQN